MNPAPIRTQTHHRPAQLPSVALTSSALEQVQSALAQQNRELDAAFSSVSRLADVPFAVPPELLEEIDAACSPRPASRGALLRLNRC